MKIILIISLCLLFSFSIFSEDSEIYFETDPSTLFFNGFSFAVRRSSTFTDKLTAGLGVYKVTVPEFNIEANSATKDRGWEAELFGIDSFVDYHFFYPNKGLCAGFSLSVYNYNVHRNSSSSSFLLLVETVRAGYVWRPIKSFDSFYIFPWVGLSTDQKIAGNNTIDGESFTNALISFVPTIQIGMSF